MGVIIFVSIIAYLIGVFSLNTLHRYRLENATIKLSEKEDYICAMCYKNRYSVNCNHNDYDSGADNKRFISIALFPVYYSFVIPFILGTFALYTVPKKLAKKLMQRNQNKLLPKAIVVESKNKPL